MRLLRTALALGAALLAALAAQPALAWNSWCSDEPPVTVVMPSGHRVTVNNFIAYQVYDRDLARRAVVYGTAVPAAGGEALVTIFVITPAGGHANLHVTSVAERYDRSTSGEVPWGGETSLELLLPDPA